jgi:2-dehydropantoate 2-reductase
MHAAAWPGMDPAFHCENFKSEKTMKICVFGAGAIGGFLAARLAQVKNVEVSVVARGEHLDAIRDKGLRLVSPDGELHCLVNATDDPSMLGPQDYVFIALKAHQVVPALPGLKHLMGPNTTLIPPTTGIPYWYFHELPGPLENRQIEALDPRGQQWQQLSPERVLGCVYWVSAEVTAPGIIHHDGNFANFPIGEPNGTRSERVSRISDVMVAAGVQAPVVDDIRSWIWVKMISSLCWNPLAVLTTATLGEMNDRPEVVNIVRRMMYEADAVAERLGVRQMPLSVDERIALARRAVGHKMSMLQDLERGRPLEHEVLFDSIMTMRGLAQIQTPTLDDVYALLRLRAAKLEGAA